MHDGFRGKDRTRARSLVQRVRRGEQKKSTDERDKQQRIIANCRGGVIPPNPLAPTTEPKPNNRNENRNARADCAFVTREVGDSKGETAEQKPERAAARQAEPYKEPPRPQRQ